LFAYRTACLRQTVTKGAVQHNIFLLVLVAMFSKRGLHGAYENPERFA